MQKSNPYYLKGGGGIPLVVLLAALPGEFGRVLCNLNAWRNVQCLRNNDIALFLDVQRYWKD